MRFAWYFSPAIRPLLRRSPAPQKGCLRAFPLSEGFLSPPVCGAAQNSHSYETKFLNTGIYPAAIAQKASGPPVRAGLISSHGAKGA
jgi:hypothetical protein